MKPLKSILVLLDSKNYRRIGGVWKYSVDLSGIDIEIAPDWETSYWIPSSGVVLASDHPDYQEGDVVYMDYYNVIHCLGNRWDKGLQAPDPKYIEDEQGIKIFFPPKKVFLRERDSVEPMNGWVSVKYELIPKSVNIDVVELKPVYQVATVLSGELKGKKVYTRPNSYRKAGKIGFQAQEFTLVHQDNILATIEE